MVQGRVEGGELIRSTSDDSSISLNHSLLIMAVDFLTFSLQKAASIRYVEASELVVSSCRHNSRCFQNFQKDHPRIWNGVLEFEFLLSPKLVVQERVLGPNIRIWIVNDRVQLLECPHDLTYAVSWEGVDLATKEVFSLIISMIFMPLARVLWAKDPLAVMLR